VLIVISIYYLHVYNALYHRAAHDNDEHCLYQTNVK